MKQESELELFLIFNFEYPYYLAFFTIFSELPYEILQVWKAMF